MGAMVEVASSEAFDTIYLQQHPGGTMLGVRGHPHAPLDPEEKQRREGRLHAWRVQIGGGLVVVFIAWAASAARSHLGRPSTETGTERQVSSGSGRTSPPSIGPSPTSVGHAGGVVVRPYDRAFPTLRAASALEDAVGKAQAAVSSPVRGFPTVDLRARTNVPPDNLTVEMAVSYMDGDKLVRCPMATRGGDIEDMADDLAGRLVGGFAIENGGSLRCPL